ncbi:MAG TPA: NapC/NirT family cytochrome c [Pyrinomonadaceae bacterium]|jgi:nitrate/TMAO reductase-like tetraheme cytochrome c subunit
MNEENENVVSEEAEPTASQTATENQAAPAEASREATAEVKVPSIYQNYISLIGTVIAVTSFLSIIFLFALEITERANQPYLGVLIWVLLPGVMVFGLFIILVGMLYERRRRRKLTPEQIAAYPILDLNSPRRRRMFLTFLVGSFLFLMISGFGSYRAFEYTESLEFCGQLCHTVMKPEFISHEVAPHSKIRCVECHVGEGAEGYVRAKMGGVRQLYRLATNTYDTPIKTPVHTIRPAHETCGKCHWAEKFYGEQLRVFNHYGADEKSTLRQVRLLVNVGGGNPETGKATGIHWHMNLGNEVDFISSDDRRQNITWVRMKDRQGNITEYTTKDANLTSEQIEKTEKRRMDCIDCHNRPTHIYLSPMKAVDQSLDAQKLDLSLPYVKAKAVEVLSAQYNSSDEAMGAIATNFSEYYRTTYPDIYNAKKATIDENVKELQRIYSTYFFPEMKTDWSTQINNIGHFNAQGCFRCHDGQHFSKENKVIRNECTICHTTLDQTANGVTTPAGADGAFRHPVNLGDKNTYQCAVCHKGDRSFKHPLNLGDISRFECAECHKGEYKKVQF